MFILLFDIFSLVANVPFNEATALFTATASAFVLSELLIAAIALFTFTTSAFAASELATLAPFAFKSSAACVAVDTGLFKSVVLSTLPRPTMALVIPDTVPVKVGDSIFAFKLIEVKYGLSIAAVSDVFNLPSAPFTLPA